MRHAALLAVAALAACSQQPAEKAGPAENNAVAAEAPVELAIPAGRYKLDRDHSALEWSVSHLGLSNYRANFTDYQGVVNLDPADIGRSSVELVINPARIATHYTGDYRAYHKDSPFKTFDEAIARDPTMLNADKFPRITFRSTKVERTGGNQAKVTGDLTFLGVTRPVTLDVTLVGQSAESMATGNGAFGVQAEGRFARSAFGMAKNPIGDIVTIRFDGEFHQDVPPKPGSPMAAAGG